MFVSDAWMRVMCTNKNQMTYSLCGSHITIYCTGVMRIVTKELRVKAQKAARPWKNEEAGFLFHNASKNATSQNLLHLLEVNFHIDWIMRENIILGLRKIIGKRLRKGKVTFIVFLEIEKVFDNVNWNKLFSVLHIAGMPYRERKLSHAFYKHGT